ncbi:hypothetical protein QYM46_04480 [Brevibacterium sp. K11IcPPYGO002]|uniref:hypothetical protein n=1 Tax=Brevibacterium sp. K11IcPPYGO002 TaxID=3058837 RepID=UPI003D81C14D
MKQKEFSRMWNFWIGRGSMPVCFIAHVQGAGSTTMVSPTDQIEQPEVVHENG